MTRSVDAMIDFFLREKGELIQINGVGQTALILDVTDHFQNEDDKLIRTMVEIQTGDLILYRNETYSIISQIDRNNHSYRARMRKCNYSIAFNFKGNVKWFDAIVEGKTFSIDVGKVMSLPNGSVDVYIREYDETLDITLNQRFINTKQSFKVVGIDRTNKGIIKLNCALDMITTDDDMDNQIADRWKYENAASSEPITEIGINVIVGSSTIKLGTSSTYICHFYDNGVELLNPLIEWSIDDLTLATITTVTGNSVIVSAIAKSSNASKQFNLRATLGTNNSQYIEKSIQIKSILW